MKELITSTMMVERNGEEVEVDIDGYVSFSVDRHYGADADGNRAISKTFVDDVTDIAAYDHGEDISLNSIELEAAADKLTHKFLEG